MNQAKVWRDVEWAYEHRHDEEVWPPSSVALVWWYFARFDPDVFEEWLEAYGKI